MSPPTRFPRIPPVPMAMRERSVARETRNRLVTAYPEDESLRSFPAPGLSGIVHRPPKITPARDFGRIDPAPRAHPERRDRRRVDFHRLSKPSFEPPTGYPAGDRGGTSCKRRVHVEGFFSSRRDKIPLPSSNASSSPHRESAQQSARPERIPPSFAG